MNCRRYGCELKHMLITERLRHGTRTSRIASVCALLFSTTAWSSATAHSVPMHFEPRRDALLRVAPTEVRIVFDGEIEPAFSTIRVTDSARRRVDKGDARVDARNPRLLRVPLSVLPSGVYRVTWQILAIDGHRSEGTYAFTLKLPQ